MQIFLAL
ncbi:uncharacterized protein FFMR_13285 [Fusarium fujikuroi]|nr:uncharacterized protein FFMR_13285 [Fusarium fujikuroi]